MTNERDELAAHRLEEIQARAEAATEGPWAIWHDLDYRGFKTVGDAESYQEVLETGETEESNPTAHVYIDEDAEFIAHAREDIPWLIERVRELEARKPAVVTTAEELDALGYAAAILDDCDTPAVCIRKQIDPPRTYWAMPHVSVDAEFSSDDILAIGPATVLHVGGER